MQQMEGFGDEFMEMEASKKLETGPDFRLKMEDLFPKWIAYGSIIYI